MYLKGIGLAAEAGRQGQRALARQIARIRPKTIVCLSAGGGALTIYYRPKLTAGAAGPARRGDLALMDAWRDRLSALACEPLYLNDTAVKRWQLDPTLPESMAAVLAAVDRVYPDYRLAAAEVGDAGLYTQYQVGRALRQAVETAARDTVILVCTPLQLEEDRGGLTLAGQLTDAVAAQDFYALLRQPRRAYEHKASGLVAWVAALGALDGIRTKTAVFSRETAAGRLELSGWIDYDLSAADPTYESLLRRYERAAAERHRRLLQTGDPFVSLAMAAIEVWVREGRQLDAPAYLKTLAPGEARTRLLTAAAGVMVRVDKDGELRGEAGALRPTAPTLAEEITRQAIAAVREDPRFFPVESRELPQLAVTVSVLGAPEDVADPAGLDPAHDGLVVEKGLCRGWVLPGTGDIATASELVAAAKARAGIPEYEADDERADGGDKLFLQRFTVETHRFEELEEEV
jgi:AMMECR1 domain-containing protein